MSLPLQQSDSSEEALLVTALDFERAIHSIDPAYTHSEVCALMLV